MKRLLAAAAALLLCLNLVPTAHGVSTSAGSAILMEAESGRVLYEQDAGRPRLIASVTKLMTALVALESGCPLEEKVVIREEDTRTEGSSLYLRPGEELRLETLLYGLLLQSGNDAALAVARHCGGTVENFVAEMNRCAARLGMTNSRFANPSGLNAEGHCSTARDLALLARACLKNETLAAIAATRSITLEGRSFVNHNKLLWRYGGCVGLKTGYTEKAGRTLVSAAERDGMTLIAVTLDDPDDWRDHAALFDWGVANWRGRRSAPCRWGAAWSPSVPSGRERTCTGPCGRGSVWSFGWICTWSSSPLRCRKEYGSAPSAERWGTSRLERSRWCAGRRSPGIWRSPGGACSGG